MFENIPIIYMSVKILKFWGFIYDNNWRRYISLFMVSLLIFSQCAYLIKTHENLTDFIRNLYMLFLWVNTIMRAILLVFDRQRVESVLCCLERYFNEMQKSDDPYIQSLVSAANAAGRNMARGNLFLGSLTCIGFYIYPWSSSERQLPFGSKIPGIDEYQTPYYEILYACQMIVTPIGCCMFIPYTSLIVAFIMFGILMCNALQSKLRTISKVGRDNLYAEMIECIDQQNRILNFINAVNNLTKYIFLYEFIGFGILLCALLFLLITGNTFAEAAIVCAYITMIFAQIFMIYWYANELREQFSDIAMAAYEADWFNYPVVVQKLFVLLIMRAQRPPAIMVGDIYPITLSLFQTLLNASYKFFTVLKHVYR